MLDDELKKQLLEMKLDDVVEELEKSGNELKSKSSEPTACSKKPVKPVEMPPCETRQSKTSGKQLFFSKSAQLVTIVLSSVGVGGYVYQNYIHHAHNIPQLPPQTHALVAENTEHLKQDALLLASEPDVDGDDDAQGEKETNLEEADDTEALAIAWAEKITQLDSDLGKSVQILRNMLQRRQEALDALAEEIADLLYDNAKGQLDLYAQEVSVLFFRYQSVNARHALGIAQQMYKIDQMAKKNKDPLVEQYVQELFEVLDCKVYANYQVTFVKDLVQKEDALKQCLQALSKSETFAQIEQELLRIKEVFKNLEKNGLSQVFSQIVLLQQEIAEAVQQALQRCFQDNRVSTNYETEALLDAILQESGLDEERKAYWKNEYFKLMQKAEQQAKRTKVQETQVEGTQVEEMKVQEMKPKATKKQKIAPHVNNETV